MWCVGSVVWTKPCGMISHWPSQVMQVDEEKDIVGVRLLGLHNEDLLDPSKRNKLSWLPSASVLPITDIPNPTDVPNELKEKYYKAIQLADEMVRQIPATPKMVDPPMVSSPMEEEEEEEELPNEEEDGIPLTPPGPSSPTSSRSVSPQAKRKRRPLSRKPRSDLCCRVLSEAEREDLFKGNRGNLWKTRYGKK